MDSSKYDFLLLNSANGCIPSPTDQVKVTTARVVSKSKSVSIDNGKLKELAFEIVSNGGRKVLNNGKVGWESCGWHYSVDSKSNGPLTCQYVFVLDALNFCFWPVKGAEYEHLAKGLKIALENNPNELNSSALMNATKENVKKWFLCDEVPQLEERVAKVRELGQVLEFYFDGLAANMVKAAKGSAVSLMRLIISLLPGFRDETIYHGFQVFLYKRAQILVADLWAAYGCRSNGSQLYSFDDIDQLTMFADYRVPQLLEHLGVLCYTRQLKEKIRSAVEILPGSEEEVEIRAATVQAVERLKEMLEMQSMPLLSVEIDWILWHKGEQENGSISPPHHTLTIFY